MKRIVLVTLVMIASLGVNAQKLEFKINGLKDTTVHLANYFGKQLYYADTTVSKNGVVTFDGSKHPAGLYAVIMPGTKYFEFIIDEEDVVAEVGDINKMMETMKVKKGKSNQAFYEYIYFMTDMKKKGQELSETIRKTKDEAAKKKLQEELQSLSKEVNAGQQKRFEANKGRFVASMIKMSQEMILPEPPKDADGNITDSNYVYNYYIEHFWDGIDFKDPSIVNTPVYHSKLDKYFSRGGLLQIPDTINKYAGWMLNQMEQDDTTNRVFQYTCHHITSKYEKSNIMGMKNVFVYMAQNYYCDPNDKAYWMTEENKDKLCERYEKLSPTIIGNPAPMLILPDSTEKNWINSHKIDAEYTILYFWDPNCGHCKKTTPKLQTLYEKKFKERNIEIFAVGKATGEDFEAWKEYIHENKLTFINVGLTKNVYNQAMEDPRPLLQHTTLQSLNYTNTYDIYSTPRIFILDKDKIIRFKQLSISQLEEVLDNLTGHGDDPKIFTAEDDVKDDEDVEEGEEEH